MEVFGEMVTEEVTPDGEHGGSCVPHCFGERFRPGLVFFTDRVKPAVIVFDEAIAWTDGAVLVRWQRNGHDCYTWVWPSAMQRRETS